MSRFFRLFVVNMVVAFVLMSILGLRINISDSYPLGVYRKVPGKYHRYSLVESCLPKRVATPMIERQYMPSTGICGGYPPVIKTVYAVEGDAVRVHEAISINGSVVNNTELLSDDRQGRQLVAAKNTIIASGNVWLMSVHSPDSYDSRYFGQIPTTFIRSKLEPLWTLE